MTVNQCTREKRNPQAALSVVTDSMAAVQLSHAVILKNGRGSAKKIT